MKIRHALGLDGAVACTFLARVVNIVGSTGTVLLIVRYLSPVEQGYYYTLLSLVSLQLVFEMGFSFVIQQLAAHECVHLELRDNGTVSGDPVAHARLASTLQLSLRWYTAAALVMGLILAPLGLFFFARHAGTGAAQVAWLGPWLTAVAASMLGLWCMPFYAFIEGCGQVREVAAMRIRQSLVLTVLAWGAMLLHHGLYSPALVIVGQTGTGLVFLISRRRLFFGLWRRQVGNAAISWNREVWPFQWRTAISWMCYYFTVQTFIPILFAVRGAVEAGQMGMSLSISNYMTVLALSWTTTKTTPFGNMVARREFQSLDRLFLRSMRQSLSAFTVLAVAAFSIIALFASILPSLSARMVSPPLFALLVITAGANCIVQALGTLLRSFKSEPFLIQSVVVASLTLLLTALTARRWGNSGATLSYLVATAAVGLPFAGVIFLRARRGYLTPSAIAVCGGNAR
jgi:hypothetical protein